MILRAACATADMRVCAAQTLTDNLLLYSYQQWESKQDFYEHIKSKAVQPLAEYVKDKVTPLPAFTPPWHQCIPLCASCLPMPFDLSIIVLGAG